MNICLAAFTQCAYQPGTMPPYINVSFMNDGLVRITVRGPGVPDGVAGPGTVGEGELVFRSPEAYIDMTRLQFRQLIGEGASALVTVEQGGAK